MALSKERDDVLVSMLPFGPWSRFRDGEEQGGRVGPLLNWVVSGHLVPPRLSSMLFGAFSCRNVAFVREGLSDGLSWAGPGELSGLPCKSG